MLRADHLKKEGSAEKHTELLPFQKRELWPRRVKALPKTLELVNQGRSWLLGAGLPLVEGLLSVSHSSVEMCQRWV